MGFDMRFPCFLMVVLSVGCGEDPILEKVNSEQTQSGTIDSTEQTTANGSNQETQAQTKSITTLPTIAPPADSPKTPIGQLPKVAPPAVEPPKEQPQEAVPPPPPNPKDGEFITISGTIEATNPSNKPIRIDIFDGDQRNIGGKRPSVVVSTIVDAGPTFEIFLPKKDQMLWVGAYIDEDDNGRPGPLDPSGWYVDNPISGEVDNSKVILKLGIPNDAPP